MVTAVLPAGLTAEVGSVTMSERRGAVVGVATVSASGYRLYLPVVIRP